ncbi:MAG: hypothetical protein Q9159_004151 [Coniocarpon cinnabarinum]
MDASDRPQAYGGYGPMNVKFVWSMIGLYTIILGIRTYISLRIVRGGGQLSLVLAYVAWLWGIAGAALCTQQMYKGMGNHLKTVTAAGTNISELIFYQWIYHSVQTTAFPIARFSVLAFLLDVQGPTHHIMRRALIAMCSLGDGYGPARTQRKRRGRRDRRPILE